MKLIGRLVFISFQIPDDIPSDQGIYLYLFPNTCHFVRILEDPPWPVVHHIFHDDS